MVVGDHHQDRRLDIFGQFQERVRIREQQKLPKALPQVETYNILLLGGTQSGKSTFIEAVKQYADPNYKVNDDNIGDGVNSLTKEVVCHTAYTTLPVVKVVEKLSGAAIQVESLVKESEDYEDYEFRINDRKNVEIKRSDSSQTPYLFHMLDTPGLNDTDSQDEVHIAKIFQELKVVEKIHLVLITIGQGPFTKEFTSAIQCYLHMFPEFQGLIAFLHTHTDYKNLHPEREDKLAQFAEKKNKLNEMMGRNTCMHFYIDCELSTKRPIRISMTQTIIRRILCEAPFNEPVMMSRVMMYKTPKMQEVDDVLIVRFNKEIEALTETVRFRNKAHATIIDKLYQIGKKLEDLLSKKQDLEEYIRMHNNDELHFLDELTMDQKWRVFKINKKKYIEFPSQEYIITKINVLKEKCKEGLTQGGEGYYYWRQFIRRHRFKDAKLHAKFYTTKSRYYRIQISSCKSLLCHIDDILPDIEKEQAVFKSQHEVEQASIEDLLSRNKLYTRLNARLADRMMKPEIFQKLVDAKAYSGSPSENIQRVEKVYTDLVSSEGLEPVCL